MGFGAAITFLAIGAALTWAVEVDLPAMDDDALGAILLCAGVISLAATVVMSASRAAGGSGVAGGVGLVAAGAVLTWAIQIDLPYVFDGALGMVLMVAGLVSVAAHLIMHLQSSRSRHVVERAQSPRF